MTTSTDQMQKLNQIINRVFGEMQAADAQREWDSGEGIPAECRWMYYGTKWKQDLHCYTVKKDPRPQCNCYYYFCRKLVKVNGKPAHKLTERIACKTKREAMDLAHSRHKTRED